VLFNGNRRTLVADRHRIGAKGVPTTRHESGWTTVAKDEQLTPFYLKDDKGVIRIIPEGAESRIRKYSIKPAGFQTRCISARAPAAEIANSDHERRFVETAVPLHAGLYVMGQARERQDIVAAEIAKTKKLQCF